MASSCSLYDLDHAVRVSRVQELSSHAVVIQHNNIFFVYRNNLVSAYPPACPQNGLNYAQSEDCLYLTIYVPVKAVAAGTSLNTFLWCEPLFLLNAARLPSSIFSCYAGFMVDLSTLGTGMMQDSMDPHSPSPRDQSL